MVRLGWATLVVAIGVSYPAARQAVASEEEAKCTVEGVSYTQACTEPGRPQGRLPRLMDEGDQPQPCRELTSGSVVLARLEILLDTQNRVVRAKVVGTPGSCAKTCLGHAFTLAFEAAPAAPGKAMQEMTVICMPGLAKQRAEQPGHGFGSTSGCS